MCDFRIEMLCGCLVTDSSLFIFGVCVCVCARRLLLMSTVELTQECIFQPAITLNRILLPQKDSQERLSRSILSTFKGKGPGASLASSFSFPGYPGPSESGTQMN